jgi:hypothetical protein
VVKSKVFLDLSSPSVMPNTHPQFRNFLLKMPYSSLPSFSTDAKHSLKLISGVPPLSKHKRTVRGSYSLYLHSCLLVPVCTVA